MRMAEIGNGNICRRCGRESLGGARQRFLPSTGLSYSSDSADTESIQVFYGYSQRHNNTDKGFISIGHGFFCSHLLILIRFDFFQQERSMFLKIHHHKLSKSY